MKKVALLCSFSMGAVLFCVTIAHANCPVEAGYTCAFYGGDFDPNNPNSDGVANETDAIVSGNPYGAAIYQNFLWGGGAISGLATNNLSGLNPATGYWEIRSGMSEGTGGTLIASGTGATSNQATGRSDFGYTEYTNFVGGLNVNLSVGQYWMAVVPNDPNSPNRSFNSNTFGLNSVGTQISGQQIFNSEELGANWANTTDYDPFWTTFSQAAYTVPEPSSIITLSSGLIAIAGVVRRRLSR